MAPLPKSQASKIIFVTSPPPKLLHNKMADPPPSAHGSHPIHVNYEASLNMVCCTWDFHSLPYPPKYLNHTFKGYHPPHPPPNTWWLHLPRVCNSYVTLAYVFHCFRSISLIDTSLFLPSYCVQINRPDSNKGMRATWCNSSRSDDFVTNVLRSKLKQHKELD